MKIIFMNWSFNKKVWLPLACLKAIQKKETIRNNYFHYEKVDLNKGKTNYNLKTIFQEKDFIQLDGKIFMYACLCTSFANMDTIHNKKHVVEKIKTLL